MISLHSQRVHEDRGVGGCMAGRSRRVLALGAGTVLIIAGMAGFVSSEFTFTLAIGAFGATLTGGAWLLLSAPSGGGQRSIGHASVNAGTTPTPTDSVENLPDPMASGMDMPL